MEKFHEQFAANAKMSINWPNLIMKPLQNDTPRDRYDELSAFGSTSEISEL